MRKPKAPPITAAWNACYNCHGTGKEPESIRCYHNKSECHMPYGHIIKRKGTKCDDCKGEGYKLDDTAWHATKEYYRALWRKQYEEFKKAMFATNSKGFLSQFFIEGLDSEMAYRREAVMETI